MRISENLINSSLSAPTKIEELTAGSDEKKHSAAPPGIEPRILRILVARSNWATKPQRELRVNFRLSPSCQFFLRCVFFFILFFFSSDPAVSSSIFVGAEREELIRNDPDKSEFTIEWI